VTALQGAPARPGMFSLPSSSGKRSQTRGSLTGGTTSAAFGPPIVPEDRHV